MRPISSSVMTAKLWASAPVPAVVGTATIGPPGREVRAVVLELPDRAIVGGPEVDRLGGVHRRPAADRRRRPCRRSPNARRRRAPRSTVDAPGFGSTSAKTPAAMPAAASTLEDRSTTPARRTPGSVTTNDARRHRPRRPPRGVARSAPTPKQHAVAQDHLEPAIGQRASADDLDDRVGRGVAPDRQPAPAAERRGTSARW